MKRFSLSSTVATYPTHPYEKIKNDILGSSYTLSLVFIGEVRAKTLNQERRNKQYTPDVLSFPLGNKHGEIYISPKAAARKAREHAMTPKQYVGYVYIHGLLHLKGMAHGDTMSKAEKRYLAKYQLV